MPALNLGNTSLYDGALPPDRPTLMIVEYLAAYGARHFKDDSGRDLSLPTQKISTFAPVTQVVYTSPNSILDGASWGFTALLPILASASVQDGLGNTVLASRTGAGDAVIGPFFSPKPVTGPNGPVFAQFVELDFIVPTGRYDRNAAINPGSNFWSFNPFYAATLWVSPQWSFSGRFHYLWNAPNDEPNVAFGPGAMSTQAGQAFHMNLTTQYQINPTWAIGINGYLLEQFTDTKVNGIPVPGRRERVSAIGPGLILELSKSFSVFVNGYKKFDARNRSQGEKLMVRFNAKL